MAKIFIKSTCTLDKKTSEGIRSIAMALDDSKLSQSRSPFQILESLEKKKKATSQEKKAFKKSMEANKRGWDL